MSRKQGATHFVEEDSGSLSITDVVMREVSSNESVRIAVPINQVHDVNDFARRTYEHRYLQDMSPFRDT